MQTAADCNDDILTKSIQQELILTNTAYVVTPTTFPSHRYQC